MVEATGYGGRGRIAWWLLLAVLQFQFPYLFPHAQPHAGILACSGLFACIFVFCFLVVERQITHPPPLVLLEISAS